MARPNNPASPAAKLTSECVKRIRSAGYYKTALQLADEHGVHYRTIEKIRARHTWGMV